MNQMGFSWIVEGQIAGHRAPSSDQDLQWLRAQGILSLARMAEAHRSRVNAAQLERLGLKDCHEPVPDFTAPKLDQIDRMIEFIVASIAEGRPVGVSCGAGLGRTGTILACYLVKSCLGHDEAINQVRAERPGSVETRDQEAAIAEYARRLGKV